MVYEPGYENFIFFLKWNGMECSRMENFQEWLHHEVDYAMKSSLLLRGVLHHPAMQPSADEVQA